MKKKGKVVKRIIVIVILIALVGLGLYSCKKKADSALASLNTEATDTISVRSLIKSVGATGNLVSVDTSNVTVELTGTKIKNVNVKVGDVVNVGDLLASFESKDIEDNLARAEETLEKAVTRNEMSLSDTDRNLADAERNNEYQLITAANNVESAKKNYDNAVENYNNALTKLDELKEKEADALKTFEDAKESFESIKLVKDICEGELNELKENGTSAMSPAYTEAQQKYTSAQSVYASLSAEKTSAETKYNAAVSTREAQETAIKTTKSTMESMLTAYETAQRTYENTVASQNSSLTTLQNNQTLTTMNLSTYNEQKQVDTYKNQLEKCTVYAPISGVVTAVNVKAGDTYTGAPIVTIKDCSAFEVEAEIGEYDISDIKVGQKVLIKTKATGDKEINGTVSFVSPTATTSGSMMSTGSEVKYKVRISVDEPNERLRLDMSASISIIVEQHDNAYTVPYSAVWTDENGNTFITVKDGDDYKDIAVTVLMESNYYTEISGDGIKEGMTVKLIESESDRFWMFRGGF